MKRIGKYTAYLFITLLSITACSDDDSPIDTTKEYNEFAQLKNDGSLLMAIKQEAGSYIFQFETDTLTIPESSILSVETNPDLWNTQITLQNQSSIDIPTLGTSIDDFINDIKVNPSGVNPLAVRIRLGLPCGGRIHASVVPKEGSKAPVLEHLFDYTNETTQLVDVLGLYADYTNKIELTYTDKSGNPRAKTIVEAKTPAIETRGFRSFKVITAQPDKMEPGLNLVNSPGEGETDTSIPYMVDADGELRWILLFENSELKNIGAQCGLHRMKNGNYLTGDANFHKIVELDILGNVVNKWDISGTGYLYHHEIIEAENGNFLITVSKDGAKLSDGETVRYNDHIIEFDPQTNSLVHEWDLANMLDTARYIKIDSNLPGAAFGQTQGNWAHNNAILQSGNEEYLASARFQGIFKYDARGNLKWIIAPHKNWRDQYKPYLLTAIDQNGSEVTDSDVINGDKSAESFDWTWGVHNPVLKPNGHILAFDNGYCRNYVAKPFTDRSQYSRIVEYEVDETNKTVRQVWQYGIDRHDCYAPAYSAVQYLEKTENVLFCPGMQNVLSDGSYGARVIEIDPKTNEVVYELEIMGGNFHRANRITLYPENL